VEVEDLQDQVRTGQYNPSVQVLPNDFLDYLLLSHILLVDLPAKHVNANEIDIYQTVKLLKNMI